ncbi:MAG: DUF1849 family protein [Alphaproteobacteria bacterium]
MTLGPRKRQPLGSVAGAEKTAAEPVRRLLCAALAAVTGLGFLFAASNGSAAPVGFIPHRAYYGLTMHSVAPGSTITDIRGALFVEWIEGCEGWSSSQRLKLRLFDTTRPMIEAETRFASWESNDGLTYNFNLQNLRQGIVNKELGGRASLRGEGMPGTAEFVAPRGLRFELPAGTIFPMVHLKELIEAGGAGEKVVSRIIFDGTTEEGPFEINAVIGPRRPPETGAVSLPAPARGPSWLMRLAFFRLETNEVLPFYEMSVQLLENGIGAGFFLDYGDSVIRAELQRIELLPRASC